MDETEEALSSKSSQASEELQNPHSPYKRPSNQFAQDAAIESLEKLELKALEMKTHEIGYPCNNAFNLDPLIEWWQKSTLSKMLLNDAGDPRNGKTNYLTCHEYEIEILKYFADLFKLPFEETWGYVTNSGTGGNEHGLYLGRERMKEFGKPVLYSSEEAHYSIQSLARLLDIEHIIIESYPTGEMDYFDLKEKILPDRPAIFSLSIGSTFKGAIDNIDHITKTVKEAKLPGAHYHADAALFGGYLSFIEDEGAPKLNFSERPYDSIAVSGHKFFGSPVPLGVFLTRRSYLAAMQKDYIEYIRGYNTTIPCSRSSLNTLILWWTLATTPNAAFKLEAKQILENAKYLHECLVDKGIQSWVSPYSNVVYFTKPSEEICKKWGLATVTCKFNGPLAHVITMQHVDRDVIDAFIGEMVGM
ncbi:Histidine decarboxylase [Chlamydiales bacterium SCGC AG-110-M15]|nr:Histidine decarboxylase [Chlamydiales bacterium SCGC AG-110-M15]